MNDYRYRWSRTEYPKQCPECGGATAVRRPGKGKIYVWSWIVFGFFLLKGITDMRKFNTVRAFTPSFLAAMAALVLGRVHKRLDGDRFRKHGFVFCEECGWVRCGEEAGSAMRAIRERGLRWFRTVLWMLPAPIVFFAGLRYGFGIPIGGLYALAFVWIFSLAGSFHGSFMPQQRQPESARKRLARERAGREE
jgi:hypothetical protein